MKFEAAQQATRKDRHPIRAVNESDTSNSGVERLERQMRSFMNRVESLMSQKADGKKTLKCWTPAVEKGICREAAGHAKALKLIASPRRRTESIRQVTANENITIPPRTEIIVPGYIGNDSSNVCLQSSSLLLSNSPQQLTPDLLENVELSLEQKKSSAERLFQEFEDVFSRNSSDIGHTTVTQHRIDTGDHPPIKQHPRRLPFAKQEEVGTLLREMQENDIIEPSSSPWASPIVLVHLKSGYWQVEIHPEDREKQHSLPAKDYGSSKSCRSGSAMRQLLSSA
ncbi:retrovirus-related Pol polyprotein from transposon 412 [Trichonephila clavipes]|nr:retrovirus-related Pol polyprotein from transposon 412 [Trichonephila clavipes]